MPDPIQPAPFPEQNLKKDREITPSWFSRHSFSIFYGFLVLAVCVGLGWLGQRVTRSIHSYFASQIRHNPNASAAYRAIDHRAQVQAEELFNRLASGDEAAADSILSLSDDWTGKTQRTSATSQSLTSAINSPNIRIREAAIQAELALEGITRDEIGLKTLEGAVGDPRQRVWALWLLGALGNRGVNPDHAAKIIESYLNDANVNVRATAVDGLSLVATDETLPMLLDRFRNDPSPIVQERAACDMAQSGMYSHALRMRAAESLVRWLDDPLLTGQQRTWTFQALHDITGASLGSNSAAWRDWWSKNSKR